MLDFVIGTRSMRLVMAINKLKLTTPESLGGNLQQFSSFLNFFQGNLFSVTSIFTSQMGFVRTPRPPSYSPELKGRS